MTDTPTPHIIRGINKIGVYTLIRREVGRFMSVYMQTIVAPIITTLLFYAIFALAFGGVARMINGVPFLQFLIPGLIMMVMVQNAFANTSSSIVISKVQGNIVDILLPPLSETELMTGFVAGGVIRGIMVGVVVGLSVLLFVPYTLHAPSIVVAFAFLGTIMLSTLGVLAGLWSDKFDHMAAFTNFIITPLTFLSGTFYSVESLPPMWHGLAKYNPFFYMIDGFRYGFIGQADGNVTVGLVTISGINIILLVMVYVMLRTGYKIKS